MTKNETFMSEAIRLSMIGVEQDQGGPFGCVIVKDGEIISRGWNQVLATNDPTAHAEVEAIREACRRLGDFHLTDCELYASCEPCPMCLGAIYWARLKTVYFANTRTDAAAIGFNDSFIYEELNWPQDRRSVRLIAMDRTEALKVFDRWKQKESKRLY